ncbi:MAG: FCD domain-containing protein, partial [Boseongicola sp. SB0667_bin_21]|nr:FCD domain-containing protein [Boseongicola sp. SB0667_bin_21]
ATPQDIETLEAALVANRDGMGDTAAFERTDVEFHLAIAKIGDNPVFTALHSAIAEWLTNQRAVSLKVKGVEASAFESHEKIYQAIASHEPEQAWQAMDQHLRDIMQRFEEGSHHGSD